MTMSKLFGSGKPKIDLIVDVSNLVYRAHYRFKDLSYFGKPSGHIYGSLSMLTSLVKTHGKGKDYRFVFATEYGRCQWRKGFYPAYKENRQKDDATQHIIADALGYFANLPCVFLGSQDYEADDVIAAHVTSVKDREKIVFSMDRDLWQLADKCSIVLDTKSPAVSLDIIEADFLTRKPHLIPLVKALTGDSSDNISGVKNFSKADLKALLELIDKPSYDDLLRAAESCVAKLKPRTLKQIQENKQLIDNLLQVTTLRPDCPLNSTQYKGDKAAMHSRLEELGCQSLASKLDEVIYV